MVQPVRRMEDGRLSKAAQSWEIEGMNRRQQPLTTWDYNVQQAMEFSDQRICCETVYLC